GKIAGLDAEELRVALNEIEAIVTVLQKIGSYAWLIWSTDSQNPELGKLLAKAQEHEAKISQTVLFFELEWANAPDEVEKLADHPVLEPYRHYLKIERLNKPYRLSEPEEKLMSQMDLSGASGWTRYFGEVMSNQRFPWEGEEITQSEILSKVKDPDREIRRRAADVITDVLTKNLHTTTFVFNMILLDKSSRDNIRGYKNWVSSRNLANQVDDATVEALIDAVTGRYDIVARYYRLLKKVLGYDELYDYDRYAPVEETQIDISWGEARDIVLNSFSGFDPRMADIAGQFFEKNWIDAAIHMGKRGGAYSASTSARVHPYIFMNYDGHATDVMTLAHELGHGVHQYLSRDKGELQAHTPLTTAEMASTFGEMLVFDYLTARTDDPAVRFSMRMEKITDTFATIFRQVSMNRFENAIHTARREQGELSSEQLSDSWQQTQQAMFRDSVIIRDDYRIWWSYIPHFLNTPGYVYAYAFGELLVWALYARYQKSQNGFAERYLDVLRAGGSDWPHNILAPLDVDLKDPQFWHEGLGLIENFVTETEKDAESL
ncbi:MAG TPA: M3 family oligoendopeptidase, partial [Aggregatilineales bacterium]|nr:M3 family oligoendopeptidase [Aggregatilineales bacterium]